MGSSADVPIRPEDVPADLVDAVYPACLEAGIPWHDDAVRILAVAVLTEARERIANAIWTDAADHDWDLAPIARHFDHAVAVARTWPGNGTSAVRSA